ncbi:cyclase family protein [Streptomyces sp. NBC_01231]|nr:cyclase family protein [Streptomyces sp. NBC_01231]
MPVGSFVALRTDWSSRWPDAAAMANRDADGVSHCPGWSAEELRRCLPCLPRSKSGRQLSASLGVDASPKPDSPSRRRRRRARSRAPHPVADECRRQRYPCRAGRPRRDRASSDPGPAVPVPRRARRHRSCRPLNGRRTPSDWPPPRLSAARCSAR